MKKIFTHLFAVLLLSLVTTGAWAQISAGKIYNIVNVGNSGYSLAAVSTTTNSIVATDESDYSQLWYVGEGTADGSYTVRNLSNGFYLQTSWRFAKTEADLYCVTAGSDYTLSATNNSNGYDNMHYGANQGYVVGWSTDASATQWTFNEVTIDNATLQANWDEIAALEDSVSNCAAYKALLDNIFSDNACTTIKPGYSEASYSGLPYGLRKMVDKVNSGDWSEPNADNTKEGWDHSYAKRFRLQMYEPYSIAGDITSWLRMNTHANNDNPTGVYVNGRGLVYVMVEGEIKEGATLRLIDAGHNHRIGDATSGGFELKTGLNVIPCYGKGGHLYVCYNVDTYNADGTTAATRFPENRKLSNYPPLKIHIEGGAINGYYNACGDFLAEKAYDGVTYNEDLWKTITNYSVDCDADWEYMETRANLRVLPILAHRQILLFQLEDTNGSSGMKTLLPDNVQVPPKPYSRNGLWDEYNMRLDASDCKINIMMEAWDRIMYSEHATLGLVSQSTMDKMNELYPRWNADGTTGDIYAYDEPGTDGKTYKEFCEVDYSEYFNHHGVGLGTESGYMSAGGQHCNYNISTFGNIVGQIASDAGSLWGPAHEIGHQHQGVFNIRGGTEVTNNVFSNAAVWYMGMATSRVNGTAGCLENVLAEYNAGKPFIDYDIWAMTQLFYKLWLYYHVAGHNTQFYPRFFEMLRRDPLNAMGGTANGTESMLKIYEKMCDASGEDLTEFFRIHGFFVTLDNYPKGDYGTTVFTQTQEEVDAAIARVKSKYSKQNLTVILINDGTPEASVAHDGTTKRALWDAASAEFGAVGDYIDGETSVSKLYDAVVSSDGTVTMSGGEGGVGFLVLDENGKVVSFSNKSTFALSDEAAYLLATGKAELVALDGEDNKTEANVDLTAVQSSLMEPLVADVENLLKYVDGTDGTYTKVGYFKASSVVDLQSALETAKATIETGTGLAAAYELLYTEYQNVLNNENAKVAIISGAKYAIKSKSGNDYMDVDNSGNVKTTASSTFPTDDSDLWIIEIASKDTYRIKNASTGKYLQEVSDANSVNFTVGDNAVNYGITNVDYVYHAFSTKKYPGRYMDRHSATQVATWGGAISNNAKWFITLADDDLAEKTSATAELQAIVEKTEALVNSLATVSTTNVLGDELPLQCTAPGENYYISCSNPHPNGDDGAGGVAALLDNNNGTYLHTNWTSGQVSATNDYLQVYLGDGNELNLFRITGVQRGGVYNDFPKDIEIQGSVDGTDDSWTTITTVTDLSTEAGATWERDVKSLRGYKYLRFIVTTTNNRIYFHMAEFSIFNLTSSVSVALLEEYNEYSATLTEQLITEAYEATERGKEWIACPDATTDELEAYASTLQGKYDALYAAYKKVVDGEKEKLQTVINNTEGLITQAGTATVTADAKIDLLGKLYAERPYTAGGTNHSDYSTAEKGYNLLDGNTGTHFHSDYNYSTMVSPPYIRVDLGEGNTANKFKFNYTTRAASGCAPTTLNVYGSNEQDSNYTLLGTFTSNDGENPLPTAVKTLWTSTEIISATAYRYFKFEVAVSEGSKTENGVKKYYFAISEFGFQKLGEVSATINQEYTGMVSESLLIDTRRTVNASETMVDYATDYAVTVEQIKAQTAAQQAAYDALNAAMTDNSALKSQLSELLAQAQALYVKVADENNGVVDDYYKSAITQDNINELIAQIQSAGSLVKDGATPAATDLQTAISELGAICDIINGIIVNDLAADARTGIEELIAKMETLLGEVADKTTAKTAFALQVEDEESEFYIWSNATASDCDGIGALIDKNDDGSAKTGTFFGTVWQGGAVTNYTHYIEVDLGTDIALSELSFDYTTRNSDHSNQRPTSIKISASNDKEGEYTEIATLSEGMPVGKCVKWEMDGTVALDGCYRYIRFAVATEKGFFNMSDFNLYAHSAMVANSNYRPAGITGEQLYAMNVALLDGIAARDKFVTEDNYNAAVTALQAQYDALLAIKNANKTDKDELKALVAETNDLVNEVVTINETETVLTMQCTDVNAPYYLYCNADGTTHTTYPNDANGVKALLDTDTDNHLHTTYEGEEDDDLDHYLRLDMGKNEALMSFKFSYTGRVDGNGNAPKTMVIEGSNDLDTFDVIATLTDLPTTDTKVTYTTPSALGNGKAYRYIRFMVTETKNNDKHDGHPYFVLSQFSVTACKTIEVKTEYVSPNLPLSTLVTANNEVVDATVIKNQFYVTETVYDTTEEELQAAYNALNLAKNLKELPVTLTTDKNNPVLYKIRINRSALKVLAIDDSDAKVPVEDFVRDDDTQSWYFMQGTNTESYDDIQIFPYWYNGAANTTLRLGAASAGNAAGTVTAVEGTDATNTIQNWYITRASGTEEGWWNIQPEGKTNYFSNNGGITNKMGFWNSASDNGSEFQFLLDGPYTDLSIIFGSVVARQPEYNAPGYYANAADYNAVYDIASGYVTNANGTDEQYTAALDNLIDAETALSDGGRVPSDALEDGAVYRIMNLITNTAAGFEYHYIQNSSATIAFPTTPAVDDNSCLWVCKANSDGSTYEFVSALGTLSLGWKEGSENAQAFTIADGVVAGAKCMKNSSSQRMALTNEKYGSLAFNHASNGEVQDPNWSTDWYFDKIDDADVKFNVNISSRRFSSLYLPYDVEVPEGVSAFTAVNVDGDKVDLYRVADRYDDTAAGSIIPARTPVILYLEDEPFTAGVYTFTYAPGAEALSDAVAEKVDAAIIFGKILQTPIQCDANTRYYKLGGKSGDTVSKMYWMYKEYGSDGTITNPGTDDGGYIRCSANKIYMTVAESVASNSFSMRFGIDSGTTDINEVNGENADVKTIYDLQGRKLTEITEPGMYIVDGKKVYVK